MARELRKVRVGRVVSNKMYKTAVVAVRWQQKHPIYKKSLRRVTKFYAHDEENKCMLGDMVRIEETRPISSTKRWRVLSILESHEVAEVKPEELDQGLLDDLEEDDADHDETGGDSQADGMEDEE